MNPYKYIISTILPPHNIFQITSSIITNIDNDGFEPDQKTNVAEIKDTDAILGYNPIVKSKNCQRSTEVGPDANSNKCGLYLKQHGHQHPISSRLVQKRRM
ncbi:hypothetical protein Glove_13g66 [Diversispora epigaea]|uniref:Uncharacterized protein n=1 Tax=Diversispora epigaea TaxID=1348612 RepID=A0A397JTU5_9GLOM|nr:hypothetical protein Glove_13g66 [Diversispora epigaea]